MIQKLLVANRGEIAVRIIRSARKLGIRTVAVFSDADKHAIHVSLADEAVLLGPPEPSLSYLNAEKILSAAEQTGSDAIHPGYGFLSERADFSEACRGAGVIFVGPPPEAMRQLGAKIDAKDLAVRAGVPIVPGFFRQGASDQALWEAAREIGFPVMLKASAGGGGRGMRVVPSEASFLEQLRIASAEAENAFGDGSMMVEKLIESPRHVEVQVLADRHGNVACLFERECSIQRRHQKLIEECPSPVWKHIPGLSWESMRTAAERLIREAGYVGAGTVEFIVDPMAGQFYFLEVNARLQVEHPVTEEVVGLDLVGWQLKIASGKRLDIQQHLMSGDRLAIQGHAIEARIVAEDPAQGFLPSSGKILAWAEPKMPGVRVDTGYGPGGEVPRHYDSLLAKVIAHGETRDDALSKLMLALLDFHVVGVRTNVSFLISVLGDSRFLEGRYDTGFLDEFSFEPGPVPLELGKVAAAARSAESEQVETGFRGAWDKTDSFRIV